VPPSETKKALIVVRTYPVPARTGVEVSCTAAITESGEWLRLFPIPYRLLDEDKQFRKYQWVNVGVIKAPKDSRPESYRIQNEAITILEEPLSTANDWQARKAIIYPLRAHCMCCLQRERDEKLYPTLGFFRPKSIDGLIIKPDTPTWTPSQLAILRQKHLFREGPKVELEKVPFKFQYQFTCDESDCPTHTLTCTDWEMGVAWLNWYKKYGAGWEAKFRQKFEQEMIHKFDTHFYVGTIHQYPNAWIIVGLFYPPRPQNLSLFE
jgi:hypothetical protein